MLFSIRDLPAADSCICHSHCVAHLRIFALTVLQRTRVAEEGDGATGCSEYVAEDVSLRKMR